MKPRIPSTSSGKIKLRSPEQAALQVASEQPQLGQAAVAAQLQQAGIQISASGVRYIWKKHNLETIAKRLQAIANSDEQMVLNESQQRLLERGARTRDIQTSNEFRHKDDSGRRAILISSAAELFVDRGFDRTSMRDIGRQAGLLPGSVYHHFASKTELFLAIHQQGFNTVIRRVRQAASEGRDPWDSLIQALGVHIDCMVGRSQPVLCLTGQSLAMSDHPELREQIRPYRDAYENMMRQLIDALPLCAKCDKTLLRLTILGASNWVYLWYREGKKTPQEIAQTMVEMVRNGVNSFNE